MWSSEKAPLECNQNRTDARRVAPGGYLWVCSIRIRLSLLAHRAESDALPSLVWFSRVGEFSRLFVRRRTAISCALISERVSLRSSWTLRTDRRSAQQLNR